MTTESSKKEILEILSVRTSHMRKTIETLCSGDQVTLNQSDVLNLLLQVCLNQIVLMDSFKELFTEE